MKKKHSITVQLLLLFLGIVVGAVTLCWFLNTGFLGEYYIQNKQKVLKDAYLDINEAVSDGSIRSEAFENELQRLCGVYNISVIVIDADSKLIQSAGMESEIMMKSLLDRVFVENNHDYELIEQNEKFILEIAHEKHNGMTYMEMWGSLDNGNLFMVRSVMESIHDSVAMSNRFLGYIALIAMALSAVVVVFVTKRFTRPIVSLTEISKRMTNLDFEVRYQGKEKNEIGVLGQHMNQLSDKLEKTISELKTANNELQRDIKKKEEMDEMRRSFFPMCPMN